MLTALLLPLALTPAPLQDTPAKDSDLEARVEALALSLRRSDGASALLATDEVTGLLGPLTDHVQVEPGREAAVAAANSRSMAERTVSKSSRTWRQL